MVKYGILLNRGNVGLVARRFKWTRAGKVFSGHLL